MKSKLKELGGSLRFWIVTSIWVTTLLESVASGDYGSIVNHTQVYFGAVVGIGTLDSVAKKFGNK